MKKNNIIKWLNILSQSCSIENIDIDEDYCSFCALTKECNKICPESVTPKGMLNVIKRIEELEGEE